MVDVHNATIIAKVAKNKALHALLAQKGIYWSKISVNNALIVIANHVMLIVQHAIIYLTHYINAFSAYLGITKWSKRSVLHAMLVVRRVYKLPNNALHVLINII